jgi:RNase adapter protein RapZ
MNSRMDSVAGSPMVEPDRSIRIVIISGLSGSGKSTAIHTLEDLGFFCIDNLPIVLMPKLAELFPRASGEIEQVALVVDARERKFLDEFRSNVDTLRAAGSRVEVLFLESADAVLIRRYNETRRRHPLAPDGTVEEGIARERGLLATLREVSDRVIDTSEMNPHQLREMIQQHFNRPDAGCEMNVALISFGFKYGIPAQADLVFDVRFLPNPYFVPQLKHLTGADPQVRRFVMESMETGLFLDHVVRYIEVFRPLYDREGKSYLTVAIGCTGGKHRSVVMVEEISARLRSSSGSFIIRHRDMQRM